MLEYRYVQIEDREWVEKIFKKANRRGNEYTFSNLFNWSCPQNIKIAQYKENIIFNHTEKDSVYSFPIGNGHLGEAVNLILDECSKKDKKVSFVNLDEYDAEILEQQFPHKFTIDEHRDDFDYIYESSDLSDLFGKKYHAKRNHISKFLRNYPNWKFEKIDRDNIDKAKVMVAKWYLQSEDKKEGTIKKEKIAVNNALKYYFELNLTGGILFVDDVAVAVSFGSPACDDTFVVHAEKAFTEFDGAYTMVNREFSRFLRPNYRYINREDDVGIAGLRLSKESYSPVFMYKRFTAKEV
ncbi:MAG: phosphatidylglycerol lysyltransferase domain-containing protein [Oscillospiraceae bacterium]